MYLHPERERSLDFGCGQAPAAFSGVRAWQTEDTWLSSLYRPASCSFRCDFYLSFKEKKQHDPVPVFLFWGAVVLVWVCGGDDGVGPVISSLPSASCPPPARPHDASRIKLRLRLTASSSSSSDSPRSAPSAGENKHTRC